jgi:hypothetical protein
MQSEYEVLIADVDVELTSDDRAPTPIQRSIVWRGRAESDNAARLAAWEAWDQRYGPRNQPAQALVNVTRLAA